VVAVDDSFSPLVRVARTLSAELRPDRAASLPALVTELARFGHLDPREKATDHDVAELLRATGAELRRIAGGRGVELHFEGEGRCTVPRASAEALIVFLATHAIESSARGASVTVRLQRSDDGLSVIVTDTGPAVAIAARTKLLSLDEPGGSHGRGSALPLFFADALLRHAGGTIRIEDGPSGTGVEVTGFLPSSQDNRAP
jgi:signal transduction histidine kinase